MTEGPQLISCSAIEHWVYCPRQWELIVVHGVWAANSFTNRGVVAHRRVDVAGSTTRHDIHSERSLPVWNDEIGIIGVADLVEFGDGTVTPVEVKSGRTVHHAAEVQLAAVTMCLEYMLDVDIGSGMVFLASSHRRVEIPIVSDLRAEVVDAVDSIRAAVDARNPVPIPYDDRCAECSLEGPCLPAYTSSRKRSGALARNVWRP
ncbi:MAG TPA: CRISPR-associated protein Cas4 [Microthrixaceae bacterium]|nr:CRISPR-associated protein Cas4 [Microthrixaceae bacterium]